MSATSKSIPLSLAHEQQGFRLLELPDELVDLLKKPNPPILQLKSAAPNPSQKTSTINGPPAVLCTPSQTYHVRQLQTSNSIHLTLPHPTTDKHAAPTTELLALATCSSTVELLPAPSAALPALCALLPIWSALLPSDAPLADDLRATLPDQAHVFARVPFSQGECLDAWRELGAFEWRGGVFRASMEDRVRLWGAVVDACVIEGFVLGEMFQVGELWALVEEVGVPRGMLEGLIGQLAPMGEEGMDEWGVVDERRAVRWVGAALLETLARDQRVDRMKFLEQWKEKLPEKWTKSVDIELLKDISTSPTPSTISFKDPNTPAAEAAEGKPGKRKWHERFAAMRKR
ncbi:hypothetical protein P152DRAFT_477981 [Eremomyces bilateralis CBS 781.70]|uniref:Sister chromatid cohesion protein-like protein Dcc1 n=1 Tax=Eremomyces bilateralis CBS 781.70 TaxID=1392243 RepID=A0A6G1GFS2_9PEZI|nr:uncharacterized protein P152DRAFT_477981 [Eremomyces bilateralis CBS 781.70]KAF1816903.1 hypothetical protein P152DRAFT_477981 [Eremomyces bilateralis CBS 781.70]